jgi:hypothetical protein
MPIAHGERGAREDEARRAAAHGRVAHGQGRAHIVAEQQRRRRALKPDLRRGQAAAARDDRRWWRGRWPRPRGAVHHGVGACTRGLESCASRAVRHCRGREVRREEVVERASRLSWRLHDVHADQAVAPSAQCRGDATAKAASRPGDYRRWHTTPAVHDGGLVCTRRGWNLPRQRCGSAALGSRGYSATCTHRTERSK